MYLYSQSPVSVIQVILIYNPIHLYISPVILIYSQSPKESMYFIVKGTIFSKQEVYERERAQLITKAKVAEGQVLELQQYIDNHLGR